MSRRQSVISNTNTEVGTKYCLMEYKKLNKNLFQALRYLNTYKLDSDKPFNVEKVEKILKDVMIEALENLTYDPEKCPKQAKWATTAIKAKVKEQEFDRYVNIQKYIQCYF